MWIAGAFAGLSLVAPVAASQQVDESCYPAEAEPILGPLGRIRAIEWPESEDSTEREEDEAPVLEVLDLWRARFPELKVVVPPRIEAAWRGQTEFLPRSGESLVDALHSMAFAADIRPGVNWGMRGEDVVFALEDQAARSDGVLWSPTVAQLCGTLRKGTRVEWNAGSFELQPDRGAFVTISGRLLCLATGQLARPFTWPQQIRVVLCRTPDTSPDWITDGLRECDSVWRERVPVVDGMFSASIPVGSLDRPIGQSGRFTVGLALPDLEPVVGDWIPVRILPQSIAVIDIPGQDEVPPELRVVHQAPQYHIEGYDPSALIRAVNALVGIGPFRTTEALEAYVTFASPIDQFWMECFTDRGRSVGSDAADPSTVFMLTRALFESRVGGDSYPKVYGSRISPPWERVEQLDATYPLLWVEDFPFLVARASVGSGPTSPPRTVIDWARTHGRMRTSPLHPPDDPTQLVDRVEALIGESRPGVDIRLQVWRAVGPALDLPVPPDRRQVGDDGWMLEGDFEPEIGDRDWARLLERVAERGLMWDAAAGCYKPGD